MYSVQALRCVSTQNTEALCAARGTPGSACPQPEPNATELPSCAPISASCEVRKNGSGGGGGVVRRARASRAPKAKSCATSCGTSSAKSCATPFTCLSFTCRPRAAWGAACVCWAWVPPLEDNACQDDHLHAPVCAASFTCTPFTCHLNKGRRGGQHAYVWCGYRRWKIRMGRINTTTLPSSAAPNTSSATSCATSFVKSFTCDVQNDCGPSLAL